MKETDMNKDMQKKAKHIAAMASESEKEIEAYLVSEIKAQLHGECLKISSQTETGYPDRLCIMPGGSVVWVELKSKGRKPTKLQQARIARLRELGHTVHVCDSKEAVDNMLITLWQ